MDKRYEFFTNDPLFLFPSLYNDIGGSPVSLFQKIHNHIIMISGWYRIVLPAGNQLSQHSKSDSHGHCNTQNGGVLIGDHPTEAGKIVKRKICFRSDCLTYEASKDLREIRVINCKQFYLYELETVINANAKERYCTEMNLKNIDFKKLVLNMEKGSKDSFKNIKEELNVTRNELMRKSNEDVQYLEQKMNAKDNEIVNDLKRTQPNLSTEKPIPQMCKYIAYKNLTDKSRRHDFFNSSGDACDMVAAPESGCVKSSDWQGRGLYFFLYQ